MYSRLVAIVALLVFPFSPVAAQEGVVRGFALELQTGRPLPCAEVELIDHVGHPVASTRTGLGGDFEFLVPAPGAYRLRFSALGFASVETMPESLASSESERTFRVGFSLLDTESRRQQVAQFDSSEAPQFVIGKGVPRFPDRLRKKGTQGEVVIGYAVTDNGRIDLQSVIVLHSSHPEFLRSVEQSLPDQRFKPARIAGKPTCMFRAGTFVFRLEGLNGLIEIG